MIADDVSAKQPLKVRDEISEPAIDHQIQDPATRTYLGSPSILRLDDENLLVTHDYFGPGFPRNHEDEEHLTSVYRSGDDGRTWTNLTHIAGAFWSNLFMHRGAIYLIGTSAQYGSIVIRRGDDGGNTWTHPRDEDTGLIARGGPYHDAPNYHCVPLPVLLRGGRRYRAFEDLDPGVWPTGFRSLVISAPEDADLLAASSWTLSNQLAYDTAWTPRAWGVVDKPGWLEGNIVEAPNGETWNILRFNAWPLVDKAAIVKVAEEGRRCSFDPATGFIDLPGGMSKFTVRRDSVTGAYLIFSNNNTDRAHPAQRNVLSLHASEDLLHWRHLITLLEDDSGLSPKQSSARIGFQYVDWQFDGDDIINVVRAACRGAHNFHDANHIAFARSENFRQLLSSSCDRR
jgi:hypothetical protein